MSVKFPGESEEYRTARDRLLASEIDLRRQTEAVAAERRELPLWDPGQDPRHVGTLEPLWNLFDLTPEGRPDWDEQLSYPREP